MILSCVHPNNNIIIEVLLCIFRVYEKMMEKMREIGSSITGFKRTLSEWAKKKGLQGNRSLQKKLVV